MSDNSDDDAVMALVSASYHAGRLATAQTLPEVGAVLSMLCALRRERDGHAAAHALDMERLDKIAAYVGATDYVDSIGTIYEAIDAIRRERTQAVEERAEWRRLAIERGRERDSLAARYDSERALTAKLGADHAAERVGLLGRIEALHTSLAAALPFAERAPDDVRAGAESALVRSPLDTACQDARAEIGQLLREASKVPGLESTLDEAHAALSRTTAAGSRLAACARSAEPCAGEWVSGSGGHKEHAGGCNRIALWWDGMWAYCDEHAGDRADGHYDRMPWRDVAEALDAWDRRDGEVG